MIANALGLLAPVTAAAEPGNQFDTLEQRLKHSAVFEFAGRHLRWRHYRSRFFTVSCGVASAAISAHNRGDDEQYESEFATLTEEHACLMLPLLERLDGALFDLERKLGTDNQVNEALRARAEYLVRNVFKGAQVAISETHRGVLRLEVSK